MENILYHTSSKENDLSILKMKESMALREKNRQKFLKEIPKLLCNIEKIGNLFINSPLYYHSTIHLLELDEDSMQKDFITQIFSRVPTYVIENEEINHILDLKWNENEQYFKFSLTNDFFSVSIWNHFISFSCKGYEVQVDTDSEEYLALLEFSVLAALKAYYTDFSDLSDLSAVRTILPFLLI